MLHFILETVSSHSYRTFGIASVAAIAAIVFWLTAYPTITWWDSSQYSLAAATLGVTGPPGSLLLTLLGWPVTRLPFGPPAYILNLLAGALAALVAVLAYLTAMRLSDMVGVAGETASQAMHAAAAAGAAFGALTFAFSDTLWEHAIKFTPYVLTAVFTGLILWTMLRWWKEAEQPSAWRWLALLGVLFGLDFSVHRTNALLIPGVLAWILIRHPRALRDPQSWLAGAGGLAAGLSVQLLIIPIATTTGSVLNIGDASNLTRFWDYVSLQMMGGGFLVEFFPRKAPFWSAQVADLIRAMGANFFRWDGPLGPLGVLPALVGIGGLAHLWRRDRRLGTAFALVLLLHAGMTVLYFNIPANFFRPFDRHYLPICVTFGSAIAYGCGVLLAGVAQLAVRRRHLTAALAGLVLLLAPISQLAKNWAAHDASHRYFARDFATNLLAGLPRDAILFTAGDNDTFPLWYLQTVEGVRTDVQVVNRSLANTFWYVDQILRRDASFPISLSREQRLALAPREWSDTTLIMPVEGSAGQLGIADEPPLPENITLVATRPERGFVLPADLLTLDMLRTNRWRRPLCFAITVSEAGLGWFEPYARLDGLFWRIVPIENPTMDRETLSTNLLVTYTYQGYADGTVRLDTVSRNMGQLYHAPFMALIEEERRRGSDASCRAAAAKYLEAMPPARLGLDESPSVEGMCGAEGGEA
jgi:hypothetical protein